MLTLTKSKRTSSSICSSPFLSLDLLMHFTLDRSLGGVLKGMLILRSSLAYIKYSATESRFASELEGRFWTQPEYDDISQSVDNFIAGIDFQFISIKSFWRVWSLRRRRSVGDDNDLKTVTVSSVPRAHCTTYTSSIIIWQAGDVRLTMHHSNSLIEVTPGSRLIIFNYSRVWCLYFM